MTIGMAGAGESPAQLDPVVTTATRTPIALRDATVPVIVISRAEIERSQANDLAELLRFHAGLDIGRNGGPGQNVGLFLRGSESNHALVLIDGVEINPGTLGGAAIHNLRPDVIERVEIVKGPRSALWGSEAIGGVINIITRSADGGFDWTAAAGTGRYDTRSASIEARLGGERGQIALAFANLDSDGFPTRRESDIQRAHDNTTVNLKTSTRLGGTSVEARYWEARGNTEYLDFFLAPLEQDYVNSALAAELNGNPRENWNTRFTVSQARDEILQLNSEDFVTTERIVTDWQNTFAGIPGHTLLAGISRSRENTESLSFGAYFRDASELTDLYISDFVELDRFDLLLALRHTDHDAFGSAFTWNLEHGWQITDRTRLTMALGTAYRAPDGTDRFGFGGNPKLSPERARNTEIGLHHSWSSGRIGASYFHNEIDDLVEFVFDPETFQGGNINVGQARIRGIDFSYEGFAANWRWRLAAVLQDPENRLDGNDLARRARRSLSASLVRALDGGEVGVDVLATGARLDSPFSNVVNAGYVLANLTARIDLQPRLALAFRVENLLDSNYETAAGFNSPGRGLYVNLRYVSR